MNSSLLLNLVSLGRNLSDLSDFHPCPIDRARAIVLADAFFVPSSFPPPPLSPAELPLPCLPPALPSENVSFYRLQLRRWSRRRRSCRGCDCVVVCAGEGLEEELEPYIKLAPGVGYYRHTDLGGSPPRHHLFLDPDCAWYEQGGMMMMVKPTRVMVGY